MRLALILALIALPALAAPPTTCGGDDPYSAALCAYQQRNFGSAEKQFRAIVDAGAEEPQTVKAAYFLARTMMKTGRYAEASALYVRIYEMDKPFYAAWQCDWLLGECRRAMGK
jgi:TolA-binding protein